MKGSNIKIQGVQKTYGEVQVLKDINLEINQGEFFSLLGPSGCGKTTLLRMIAGFIEPDQGLVYLGEQDITRLAPNERNVNTIFQTYALFPHLSIYDNIAFPLKIKKLPKATIDEEVKKYLDLVKLTEHKDKFPHQLSGGQKQRIAIARALVNQPSVLLLDEPLSALDAKLRQHMLVELDRIHDQVGITFVFVTHDQVEALSVSDRIAVMNKGEVLQVGTPTEIYEKPVNEFVADFIGETNFIDANVIEIKENYGIAKSPLFGDIKFELDKPVVVGNRIKISIRPEKIVVSKNPPKFVDDNDNVLSGTVDEVIYSGFQSKFFLKINGHEEQLFHAFKQHHDFFVEDSSTIHWKDEVYVTWDCTDGYLVEVI